METGNEKLGFIGAGNMSTALIKGLTGSGVYGREQLVVSDINKKALEEIFLRFGVKSLSSNRKLVHESNIVVLSVKPQILKEVLEEIKGDLRDDHLIISIAAGIPLKMILSIIDRNIPLIRVMPNTPALVQKGMSVLTAGGSATSVHLARAEIIFRAVGDTVEVEEKMMDVVTAMSGSGPGYILRIMECMVEAGVFLGLNMETSLRLVIQTFFGTSHLVKESGESLARLREMVTSPGGTTFAGLQVFEKMGLKDLTREAVDAACKRSMELGRDANSKSQES